MKNPILLYTEVDGHYSTMVGTMSADQSGRIVFKDNNNTVTMIFVDIKDSKTIAETLAKSQIKLTMPQGDKTLFEDESRK